MDKTNNRRKRDQEKAQESDSVAVVHSQESYENTTLEAIIILTEDLVQTCAGYLSLFEFI